MTTGSLHVIYQNHVVGELILHSGGELEIRFDDAYRADIHAVPLSTMMPLESSSYKGAALENWLWGLLPDDPNVLEKWRIDFGVRERKPFGLLGSPVGEDCPGAFSFVRPERIDDFIARPNQSDWLSDTEMATLIRNLKADATDWLGTNPPGRFSLAGAQSKTALLWDGQRWGRPNGSTATTHIVKPAIKGLDSHDLNEHLCLSAARNAGIDAVATEIHGFEDQTALFVRRYDRTEINGQQIRLHQEDMCQALGLHPLKKYQESGGPSPKAIANLMRIVIPATRSADSIGKFLDALVWNWLLCATDAHGKNYSMLIGSNDVALAPLYDISSTLPYDYKRREIKLAMKFGGGYGVEIRPSAWKILASDLGMSEETVRARAREIVEKAPDAFAMATSTDSVLSLKSALPGRLVDGVAGRVTSCKKSLEATGSTS
ncbi:MAG TPA: type II toxin-antitoxin system HipA family toxin [Candidatus Paceibacterota bacterium]|nr:type II toxin-antitoxin system HipA family toxin [Candidatus Paceibacterota bacterium]